MEHETQTERLLAQAQAVQKAVEEGTLDPLSATEKLIDRLRAAADSIDTSEDRERLVIQPTFTWFKEAVSPHYLESPNSPDALGWIILGSSILDFIEACKAKTTVR